MGVSKGGRRLVGGMVAALAVLMGVVAAAYPVADLRRESLDDRTRAQLLREGKAAQFVKLDSGVTHVRVSGPASGPVVLLVHGLVIGGYAFERWVEPMTQAGYRVVIPDLYGYGYSDRPATPYTGDSYAVQLDELLDALAIKEPVHIVGASMGGAVVTAFAAHAPQKLRSVTLIAPSGGGRKPIVSGVLAWPVLGDVAFGTVGGAMATNMMRQGHPPSPERDAMLAWMAEQTRFRGYGEGLLNTLRNYDAQWQPDAYQAMGRSGLPVLTIWGTADTVNPYDQHAVLKGWVPQLQLVSLEGRPHAIAMKAPVEVVSPTINFIRKIEAGST